MASDTEILDQGGGVPSIMREVNSFLSNPNVDAEKYREMHRRNRHGSGTVQIEVKEKMEAKMGCHMLIR